MAGINKNTNHLVFGLDIGTRSVVGSVGYMDCNKFHVTAHFVKEHETRAMLDGQIHDIQKVGETIGHVKHELEKQLNGEPLKEVCIAAAGRLLKTITVHVEQEHNEELPITSEDIYSLDSLGVEKAYEIIRSQNEDVAFYCVGYSVVKYYMNDYVIQNLEGHKAKVIGADVLATFLPNDVVDGLYAAVDTAHLEVGSLTLEPIAAMNVAIPQQFRLLNIALVDIGAGTSDICITKDESIIAYGMIPHAGDELTESIVHQCLVEFNVAEEIKRASLGEDDIEYQDIIGLPQVITAKQARELYADTMDHMAKEIADKIIELNGGKTVSAVFVVGGGGKVPGFTEKMAEYLDIMPQRVALRGKEVLGDVEFEQEDVEKDPTLVTPIGICINHYNQRNNFIFVNINENRIKLYDNDHLTVVDAAIQTGFPNEDLFAKRGKALVFTLNDTTKMIRGETGEPAIITVNGQEADFHTKISANDQIQIQKSTSGAPATCKIEALREYRKTLKFIVNGSEMQCPKFVLANSNPVTGTYEIQEDDIISIPEYYTVEQLLAFMDLEWSKISVTVNGHAATENEPIYENFEIVISEKKTAKKTTRRTPRKPKEDDTSSEKSNEVVEEQPKDEQKNVVEETPTDEQKEEPKETVKPDIVELHVSVNDTPIVLRHKKAYIFADIFESYPFDTKTVAGKELVTRINKAPCGFMDPISEGDAIEVFWIKNDE